jgi:hypothetical protein
MEERRGKERGERREEGKREKERGKREENNE